MAVEFKTVAIGAGAPFVNAPNQAPTIYIDGFSSATLTDNVVKVAFTEQLAGQDGNPTVRFVVNIAMGFSQLEFFQRTLASFISDVHSKRASGEIPTP